MRSITTALLVTALSTVALPAAAQDAPEAKPDVGVTAEEGTHSVNANPLGALFGSYNLNYQYLYSGHHGLLLEGDLALGGDDDSDTVSYGGKLGYRYYFAGQQDSSFLGLNLGYSLGTGETSINDTKYEVDFTALTATVNYGARWAWESGFNITARIGAGYGNYSVSTDETSAEAKEAEDTVNDLLTLIPVALDGELSVGWIF